MKQMRFRYRKMTKALIADYRRLEEPLVRADVITRHVDNFWTVPARDLAPALTACALSGNDMFELGESEMLYMWAHYYFFHSEAAWKRLVELVD